MTNEQDTKTKQHTPGPWRIAYANNLRIGTPIIADVVPYCILPKSGTVDVEATDADAHLIAAAPDLLAACNKAIDLIRFIEPMLQIDLEACEYALDAATVLCDALLKARGKNDED